MFDVGFWELLLIFGVGLMILGPERMPRVAAQIGRWIGRARRTASQLRRQLQRELELDEFMNQRRPPPTPPPKPTQNKPHSEGEAATVQDSAEAGSASEPDASAADPLPPSSSGGGEDGPAETPVEENRIASPDQVSGSQAAEARKESAKSP